ncbi:MAG: hypothetical protein U9N85_11990 [Bacteroidota bacterium]|nr:hypothetical protein [Bacteroidota bacterium]
MNSYASESAINSRPAKHSNEITPEITEPAQQLITVEEFNSEQKNNFWKRSKQFIQQKLLPGNFPSFWFSFLISAIGAYTIYGLAAGPLSVLLIYLLAKGSKSEVMKSFWGWITGTAVGLGIWILIRAF